MTLYSTGWCCRARNAAADGRPRGRQHLVITYGTDALEERFSITVATTKPVVITAAMRPATAFGRQPAPASTGRSGSPAARQPHASGVLRGDRRPRPDRSPPPSPSAIPRRSIAFAVRGRAHHPASPATPQLRTRSRLRATATSCCRTELQHHAAGGVLLTVAAAARPRSPRRCARALARASINGAARRC